MNRYRFHILAATLVVIDQITKVAVKGFDLFGFHHDGMYLGESTPLIGDAIRLTFVENPGMAFGISWGEAKIVLTLLTIGISVFLVIYLKRINTSHWSVQLAIALLLAGATGNLIDRAFYGVIYGEAPLFYGMVVDFLQVDIPDINWLGSRYTHFPVFNVADSCVTVGIIMLLFVGGKLPQKKSRNTAETTEIDGQNEAHQHES